MIKVEQRDVTNYSLLLWENVDEEVDVAIFGIMRKYWLGGGWPGLYLELWDNISEEEVDVVILWNYDEPLDEELTDLCGSLMEC